MARFVFLALVAVLSFVAATRAQSPGVVEYAYPTPQVQVIDVGDYYLVLVPRVRPQGYAPPTLYGTGDVCFQRGSFAPPATYAPTNGYYGSPQWDGRPVRQFGLVNINRAQPRGGICPTCPR